MRQEMVELTRVRSTSVGVRSKTRGKEIRERHGSGFGRGNVSGVNAGTRWWRIATDAQRRTLPQVETRSMDASERARWITRDENARQPG